MPCPKKNIDLIHQIDDGLFGLDFRNHSGSADVSLAVDDGWLTNESGSELRLILGRQLYLLYLFRLKFCVALLTENPFI